MSATNLIYAVCEWYDKRHDEKVFKAKKERDSEIKRERETGHLDRSFAAVNANNVLKNGSRKSRCHILRKGRRVRHIFLSSGRH